MLALSKWMRTIRGRGHCALHQPDRGMLRLIMSLDRALDALPCAATVRPDIRLLHGRNCARRALLRPASRREVRRSSDISRSTTRARCPRGTFCMSVRVNFNDRRAASRCCAARLPASCVCAFPSSRARAHCLVVAVARMCLCVQGWATLFAVHTVASPSLAAARSAPQCLRVNCLAAPTAAIAEPRVLSFFLVHCSEPMNAALRPVVHVVCIHLPPLVARVLGGPVRVRVPVL